MLLCCIFGFLNFDFSLYLIEFEIIWSYDIVHVRELTFVHGSRLEWAYLIWNSFRSFFSLCLLLILTRLLLTSGVLTPGELHGLSFNDCLLALSTVRLLGLKDAWSLPDVDRQVKLDGIADLIMFNTFSWLISGGSLGFVTISIIRDFTTGPQVVLDLFADYQL